MMKSVVLFLEMHQPRRLSRKLGIHTSRLTKFRAVKEIDDLEKLYFDDELNRRILERVASRCYIPTLKIILDKAKEFKRSGKELKLSIGASGVVLEQLQMWRPEVLELMEELVCMGCLELIAQTYYHSIAFMISDSEFKEQIMKHRGLLEELFGVRAITVENTEFIYSDRIGRLLEELGFRVALTEGVKRILKGIEPVHVFRAQGLRLRLLLRHYVLSDDIGFRFSNRSWDKWPLTADKYATWLAYLPGEVVLIAIDMETFGEHHPPESGIFDFLKWLPEEIVKRGLMLSKPSEAAFSYEPIAEISVPDENPISWADVEKDISAWCGNELQGFSLDRLRVLGYYIMKTGDEKLLRLWRYLTISDHFYYMSLKRGPSGEVHSYFNPYGNPYEAFIAYNIALSDLEQRVIFTLKEREVMKIGSLDVKQPRLFSFKFYKDVNSPLGVEARNLLELLEAIEQVPVEALEFHLSRGDIQEWLEVVLGDDELAREVDRISNLRGETLRARLREVIERRIEELMNVME